VTVLLLLATQGTASASVFYAREQLQNLLGPGHQGRSQHVPDCGSLKTGHVAAMVFSDGAEANNNIKLLGNDIIQNGQDGIRYFGVQTNIRLVRTGSRAPEGLCRRHLTRRDHHPVRWPVGRLCEPVTQGRQGPVLWHYKL
jgi:hypothetical protein